MIGSRFPARISGGSVAALCFAASAGPPLFLDLGAGTVPYDLALEPRSGIVRVITHQFVPGPDLTLLWAIAPDGSTTSQEITLSQTPGYDFTYLGGAGLSDDASQFVGISVAGDPCPNQFVVIAEEATHWSASAPDDPTELGFLLVDGSCGYSVATAVSNNGVVAGGSADVGQAYRWTADTNWVPLLDPQGVPFALGWTTDISAEGSTIVGTALIPPIYAVQQAVRWDGDACTVLPGQVPEASFGIALGISPNGANIVGVHNQWAALWTKQGLTEIAPLPDAVSAAAYAVTDDSFVVGYCYLEPSNEVIAFIWHPSWPQMKSLSQLYGEASGGAAPLPLQVARAIVSRDDDLHVLVRSTVPNEQGMDEDHAICVRLPRPSTTVKGDLDGDGQVNGSDLGTLLGIWGSSDPSADFDGNGIVDGSDLGTLLGAWTG